MVADKRHDRVIELHERYGVDISTNVEAAREADVVVLVVKPQDLFGVVEEIAEELKPGALVVSLAAGVTTASLEQRLPEGTPVVRVMPNTPALVDQGMSAVSPGSLLQGRARGNGRAADGLRRQGRRGARAAAGRGHGDLGIRTGLHLLHRRGHDRGRRGFGAATPLGDRADPADGVRRRNNAAGNRRTPGGPARERDLACRNHRRGTADSGGSQGPAAFLAALEAARDRSVELAAGS